MGPVYRASKSQMPGRLGWNIIFHHPLRRDLHDKPLRVHKGLETRDEAEADRLVGQMNLLLSDQSYWEPTARDRALLDGIDGRIVKCFYDDMDPAAAADPWVLRDELIPLPGPADGYTRVQFLGPTGAGKTTLVRQLIGTDPEHERFPSTSTAKTTVFDTEIVLANSPFRAVVSFLPQGRVRSYIDECVVAAVSAAAEGAREETVARRLLEHAEQRFRLSYLLGRPPAQPDEDADEDADDDPEDQGDESPEVSDEARSELEARLGAYLTRVSQLADTTRAELEQSCGPLETLKPEDRDAFFQLLEDRLREKEEARLLVEDILADVRSRFGLVDYGHLEHDRAGWPVRWTFECEGRAEFIKTVNRFSSNYARNFGRLLTPLVQGLRVIGRFRPEWAPDEDMPRLVLMDGEGIGHTPESAASLSTAVTKRYERCDAVVLVDTATQPMAAGSLAVLRSIAPSGHEAKLLVVFTHYDQVRGDNLRGDSAKKDHVRSSLENAIRGVGEALGGDIGRGLRRSLSDDKVFFVGSIDGRLPAGKFRGTRKDLVRLIDGLRGMIAPPTPVAAVPVYDMANLVLGAWKAAQQFQERWDGLLPGEHWTRVKALTRRLARMNRDEYDTLRPVADMIRLLSENLREFIATPRHWRDGQPSEEETQLVVDAVAREFFRRLHELAANRLWRAELANWITAYELRGTGSGNGRKRNVMAIYNASAPVPGAVPRAEADKFLDDIRGVFREAAEAAGASVPDVFA